MKDGIRNIVTGIINQIVFLVIGLVLPRFFLLRYGSDLNGVVSTANQLLNYFVLFEAGIGIASVQALYKPVGLKDRQGVNAILSATHIYFRRTGFWIMGTTVVLSLIFPFFIKTSASYLTVMSIIVVMGLGSGVSFFTYGKNLLLLQAENKIFVINTVTTISLVLMNILKLYLLQLNVHIAIYQSVSFLQVTLYYVMYKLYFSRHYHWLDTKAAPDLKAVSEHKSAFVHQLSALIFANTDILIIAVAIDAKMASVYAIYSMVFTMVIGLMGHLYSGVRAKLGQLYNLKPASYQKVYRGYESLYVGIGFSLINTAYVLSIPFISLYTAGIQDINYVDSAIALLFAVVSLLNISRGPMNDTVFFAGHFTATKWHSVTESAINLVVSIGLLPFIGVYGVLLGTVIALVYRICLIIWYTNRKLVKGQWKGTLITLLTNSLLFVAVSWLGMGVLPAGFNDFWPFLMAGVLMLFCVTAVYILVNYLAHRQHYRELWQMVRRRKDV